MKKSFTFRLLCILSIFADAMLEHFYKMFNPAIEKFSGIKHLNPDQIRQLGNLLDSVEKESKGFHNYKGSNSFMNFNPDAGNWNPDAGNVRGDEGILRIGGEVAAKWAQDKQASVNLATYRVSIFYTPVAAIPLPVDIMLFATAYNTGVFAPNGDLVFTNAGGDTATIHGKSSVTTFKALSDIVQTEPMGIEFLRIRPKSDSQLENPIKAINNSQFSSGSFNEISPDDYINPDQYQLLRVDVPLGYSVGKRKGLTWSVDQDQTGTGIGMVMFISGTLDPDMTLKNKPAVRNYGATNSFFTPTAPVGAIDNLITQKALMKLNG